MAYRRTDNTEQIIHERGEKVSLAIRFAIEDIHRGSTQKTPKLTGQLRSDIRKSVVGKTGKIVWGKNYARYQERGYTSGPVRRYTTPGTGPHFAEESARRVGSDPHKYLNKVGL